MIAGAAVRAEAPRRQGMPSRMQREHLLVGVTLHLTLERRQLRHASFTSLVSPHTSPNRTHLVQGPLSNCREQETFERRQLAQAWSFVTMGPEYDHAGGGLAGAGWIGVTLTGGGGATAGGGAVIGKTPVSAMPR